MLFLQLSSPFRLIVLGIPLLTAWLACYSGLLAKFPLISLLFSTLLITQIAVRRRRGLGDYNKTIGKPVLVSGLIAALILMFFNHDKIAAQQGATQLRSLGKVIEQHVPRDGLILSPPSMHWLRYLSRRSVIVDSKAVPYGGTALLEWQRRIDALGGYDWDGQKFRQLSFEALLQAVEIYQPTHILLECTDPKTPSAINCWGSKLTFSSPSTCYDLYALPVFSGVSPECIEPLKAQ